MPESILAFCTFLFFCLLYTLFSEYRKGRQHAKRMLLAQAIQEFDFSRARRAYNLKVLHDTAHPGTLYIKINQKTRTCTPVKTGPQSYPSRQAYLRRRLVIARQSCRALLSGLLNLIPGYAHYLRRQQR